MSRNVVIEPRDPLIFRDGKPFGATDLAQSLPFATPSVIAGSIRTRIGETGDFDPATVTRLLKISQKGPFLAYNCDEAWKLAFPAPADAIPYPVSPTEAHLLRYARLAPKADRPKRSNLPEGLFPLYGSEETKVSGGAPAFWSSDRVTDWLQKVPNLGWQRCAPSDVGLAALEKQRRVHVSIDARTQTAAPGNLYSTESREFTTASRDRLAIVTQVHGLIDGEGFPAVSPVGGESRLALWSESGAITWPECGISNDTKHVRLLLTTPAVFSDGYRPGWLQEDCLVPGTGKPLRMKLKAAAVSRFLPVSGWNYVTRGPKATRFLAPAGSVYFFEVLDGGDPTQLHMASISDNEQDRLDGFGLVLCGEW